MNFVNDFHRMAAEYVGSATLSLISPLQVLHFSAYKRSNAFGGCLNYPLWSIDLYQPATKGQVMRALIVDDHWAYRAGMAPLLKKIDEDIAIFEANSFAEAVKLLQGDKDFDLVLLDLHMPDSEPFVGLRAVRDTAPQLPVVVVSVSENRRDVLRALEAGAAGYIPKTAEPEQVLVAIRRVLEGDVSIPRALLEGGDDKGGWAPLGGDRGATGADPFANLTRRQREVLERLAKGMQNTDIARDLGLSVFTVKLHVSSIFKALNVSNRTEAARLVLDHGGLVAEKRGQA